MKDRCAHRPLRVLGFRILGCGNPFPGVCLVALTLALCSIPAQGQTPMTMRGQVAGQPWTGERGIRLSIPLLMSRSDVGSGNRRLFADGFPRARRAEREALRHDGAAEGEPEGPGRFSLSPEARTPIPRLPQRVTTNFVGATYNDTPGFTPPDAMGAAGPTQFLVCVNGRIRSFTKASGLPDGVLDMTTDAFFSSVNLGVGTSDPRVRFDPLSKRWFVAMINIATVNNRVLLAVSDGPTLTAKSAFTFFQFQQNVPTPAGNLNQFADYPTLGIDANALYIGVNDFDSKGTFTGTTGFVIRKSAVLSGGPIVVTAFRNLASYAQGTATPGPYTPQGVDNDDPNPAFGYFIGVDNAEFSKLVVRRVSNAGAIPTISDNIVLDVPPTSYPEPVVGPGSTCPVDTLDDRLLAAQMHRNVLTGESTLWTSHVIEVNSSGDATSSNDRTGVRWYEIGDLATTPALRQSGTLYDPASASPVNYFNGTCAMSGQGHMALGCTYGNAVTPFGVAVSGRLFTDPAGTIQPPTLAVTSLYNFDFETCTTSAPPKRWGDYSIVSVDPNDDMTLWTVQEYTHAPDTWGVRVLLLEAPPPATPSSVSVNALNPGATDVSIAVTGTSVDGSGFFDPSSLYPNHITADLGGAGVTVNSVTFNSPTQVTLNVTVSPTATPGDRTLTITNPDGQAVSAPALVRVVGAPYTHSDVVTALRIAGGLTAATPDQVARLNAERTPPSTNVIDMQDALRIARRAAGLD